MACCRCSNTPSSSFVSTPSRPPSVASSPATSTTTTRRLAVSPSCSGVAASPARCGCSPGSPSVAVCNGDSPSLCRVCRCHPFCSLTSGSCHSDATDVHAVSMPTVIKRFGRKVISLTYDHDVKLSYFFI